MADILGPLGGEEREHSADPLEGFLETLYAKRSARPRIAKSPDRPRQQQRPPVDPTAALGSGTPPTPQTPPAPPPVLTSASPPPRQSGVEKRTAPPSGGDVTAATTREKQPAGSAPRQASMPEGGEAHPLTSEGTRTVDRGRRNSGTRRNSRREISPQGEDVDGLLITSSASESPESARSARLSESVPGQGERSSTLGVLGPTSSLTMARRRSSISSASSATAPVDIPPAAAGRRKSVESQKSHQDEDRADLASSVRGDEPVVQGDPDRLQHARILGALHALRSSELSVLLSGWQADWLLGNDELCPPTALNTMIKIQGRRRPRRRRGTGQRISLPSTGASGGARRPVAGASAPALASAGTPRSDEAVTRSHSRLGDYQRAFRAASPG